MSIIITGLEMPTERESFTITIKYNGTVFDTETGIQVAEAFSVPNHGELIEREALKNECRENAKRGIGLWVDYMDISLAPTIIPSDHADTMYYPQVEGITPTVVHADKERNYAQR